MTEEAKNSQAPAAEKDQKNGITRPKSGTKTGRIWEIADTKSGELGEPANRKQVLEVAEAEGINQATAATQYGRWRKYHGLGSEPKAAPAPTEPAGDSQEDEDEETTVE